MQISMFSSEERPAKVSVLRDFAAGLLTLAATSCLPIWQLLDAISPSGWYGRTCPASCHREKDGTLAPFSGRWANSGMGSPTECLTLSTSEHPCETVESSLSDILETGDVPQRYYLSERQLRTCERRSPGFRASTLPGWHAARRCPNEEDAGPSMTDEDTDS
jgi:hypothetical protein